MFLFVNDHNIAHLYHILQVFFPQYSSGLMWLNGGLNLVSHYAVFIDIAILEQSKLLYRLCWCERCLRTPVLHSVCAISFSCFWCELVFTRILCEARTSRFLQTQLKEKNEQERTKSRAINKVPVRHRAITDTREIIHGFEKSDKHDTRGARQSFGGF